MYKHNYQLMSLSLTEFEKRFDIKMHADEQSGIFKNTTISACHQAMNLGIAPAAGVIAYQDDETRKLVAVRQSDMVNHLLALAFPEEMGISIERTMYQFVPRLDILEPTKVFKSTFDWLKFQRRCELQGTTEDEMRTIETTLDAFLSYKLNVFVYRNRELALLASNLN